MTRPPHTTLLPFFHQAVVRVLSTMAATSPRAGTHYHKPNNRSFGVVTGIISMQNAEIAGVMALSFETAAILPIVERMLGDAPDTVNQDVADAVGELTNMVCGAAKSDMSEAGHMFNMATPIVIVGSGVEITQFSLSQLLVLPYSTPEGQFVLEENLSTAAQKAP